MDSIYLLSTSFLNLLTTNKVNSPYIFPNILSNGWGKYFGGIVIFYGATAMFITIISILVKTSGKNERFSFSVPLISTILSKVYLLALIVIVIVPLYAIGIYPYMPSHIGGGQVLPVELKVNSDEIKPYIADPNNKIYLVDRATDTTLFLILDKNTGNYKAIEIRSSSIESITYTSP